MKILLLIPFVIICLNQANAQTNIYDAARSGVTATLNLLYSINPDTINSIDSQGNTPLILAAYHNKIHVVSLLIMNNVNLNHATTQGSALHGAVYKGHIEVVKILIAGKAKLNKQDANGTTALMYAVLFNRTEIAQMLFNNGADANLKDNTGDSALDYAISLKNQILINLFSKK